MRKIYDKNSRFCIYNGNEYKLNGDKSGDLIIIITNPAVTDNGNIYLNCKRIGRSRHNRRCYRFSK